MQNRFYQIYNAPKHELDLTEQPVYDADVADLVAFLNERQNEIQSLLLKCDVLDTNFETISDAIQHCQQLKTYSLDYSALTDDQLENLVSHLNLDNFQSLSIKGNGLQNLQRNGAGSLALLFATWSKLKSLSLSGKNFGVVTILRIAVALQNSMPALEALDFEGDSIIDNDLHHLASVPDNKSLKLKTLSIGGDLIGDWNTFYFARLISKIPELETIKFKGGQISDQGVEYIVQAISGNPIQPIPQTYFSEMIHPAAPPLKNLKSLSIEGGLITEEGINKLNTLLDTPNLTIHIKTSGGQTTILKRSLVHLSMFKIRSMYPKDSDLIKFLNDKTKEGLGLPDELKERVLKR